MMRTGEPVAVNGTSRRGNISQPIRRLWGVCSFGLDTDSNELSAIQVLLGRAKSLPGTAAAIGRRLAAALRRCCGKDVGSGSEPEPDIGESSRQTTEMMRLQRDNVLFYFMECNSKRLDEIHGKIVDAYRPD